MTNPPTLYAWKYMIQSPTDLPAEDLVLNAAGQPIYLTVEGLLTVAIAATQQEAYDLLVRRAREDGLDYRWLKVATVIRLDIDTACRLCWVGP